MFEDKIKFYPNFPKDGVSFLDLLPLMHDRETFTAVMNELAKLVTAPNLTAPEARGFIFGPSLLTVPSTVVNVIPFRKPGKIPSVPEDLVSFRIIKEYGEDALDCRLSDILASKTNENGELEFCIFDDVLAMGGTATAIAKTLQNLDLGGKKVKIKEFVFVAELTALGGRKKLEQIAPVKALLKI